MVNIMIKAKYDLNKFKKSVKRAEEFFNKKEHKIPHSTLLNGLSVFMGYKDWHTLKDTLETSPETQITQDTVVTLKPVVNIYIKRGKYKGEHLDKEVMLGLIKNQFPENNYLLLSSYPVNFLDKSYQEPELIYTTTEHNIVLFDPHSSLLIKSFYLFKNKNILIFISNYEELHKFHSLLTKKERSFLNEIAFINVHEEDVENILDNKNS